MPLGWAWQHGAATWTADQRLQFANDPNELLAVDGSANEAKSDYGPAGWMPPNDSFRCTYVEKFVAVLGRYSLSVDAPDKAVIDAELRHCG